MPVVVKPRRVPADVWQCCSCREYHLIINSACPLCGHYKCLNCPLKSTRPHDVESVPSSQNSFSDSPGIPYRPLSANRRPLEAFLQRGNEAPSELESSIPTVSVELNTANTLSPSAGQLIIDNPQSLRPGDDLKIVSADTIRHSLGDRLRTRVETLLNVRIAWWPLRMPSTALKEGHVRVLWKNVRT